MQFWEDLAREQRVNLMDLEKFANETAIPYLWKQAVKQQVIAAALFVAGLAALFYSEVVLGVALLLLAVHYDQQARKFDTLLVLTGYHGAIARLLNRQATTASSPDNGEI